MVKLLPGERLDYMYSDELKIIQRSDAFSFSLDTLLLADQAVHFLKKRARAVDLCAGNCAASLYAAYRSSAHFDAVEIQDDIVSQARRSVEANHYENRIKVWAGDAKKATDFLAKDSYDLVMVNPPYFKAPAGHVVNPDEAKAIARHELLINLDQVVATASQLLKWHGKLVIVHRPERLGDLIVACHKHDLAVKQIQPFCPHAGSDADLFVAVASRHVSETGLVLKAPIVVHEPDGSFTRQVDHIIKEDKSSEQKYYFYVLLCSDGSFYGGFTPDLEERVAKHNAGKGAKYTKARRPVKLIYHEEFSDKTQALKREYWFKHHDRAWKESFLREQGVHF
jgi:putative endonuclease